MSALERDAVRSFSEDYHTTEAAEEGARRCFRFLLLTAFLQGIACNLLQPFMHTQAEPLGKAEVLLSDGLHGLYLLVVVLVTPFAGKLAEKQFRFRKIFRMALFFEGLCCIAYEFCRPMKIHVVLSMLRVFQSFGAGIVLPYYVSIPRLQREDTASWATPVIGSMFVFGMAVWKNIGAQWYMSGFCPLPFATVGGALVLAACLSVRNLPSIRHKRFLQSDATCRVIGDVRIFTDLIIAGYACIASVYSQGVLGYALRKHGIPLPKVNRILVLLGPANVITAAIVGPVGKSRHGTTSFLGWLMAMVGMRLAISAAKALAKPSLGTIIFSHLMISFGLGGDAICSIFHAQNRTANNIRSNALGQATVAGFAIAAIALGRLLGIVLYTYLQDTGSYLENPTFRCFVELPMLLLTGALLVGDYLFGGEELVEKMGYASD
ncbi:uncharacterized protein LOC135393344 [Ornithodoros turicata]|uniref:uncharacterized protein LOC135393344 n=1 Tax=Ornithodoros turicata TaxID=34597 RepID=UPI003138DFB1